VVPIALTRGSTQAEPRFDGGVAPTVAKDHFTDLEQALASLVRASYPPDARAGGPASDGSADARISQSFAAATLGAADLRPPLPREPPGKRGTLARVAIAICLGASAIWALRSYGGHARDMIATWAPPFGWISARPAVDQTSAPRPAMTAANEPGVASAERRQIETMADLAALRQTVEKLAAGQGQMIRELAKLQAEKRQAAKPSADKQDKGMLRRASATPVPPVAAPTRKPAPMIALMLKPPDPPPFRPTMLVPHP